MRGVCVSSGVGELMKEWTVKQVPLLCWGKGREEHKIGRMAVGSGRNGFFNETFPAVVVAGFHCEYIQTDVYFGRM